MIDAKELRIGNLVYDNEVGHKGDFKVTSGDIVYIQEKGLDTDYSFIKLTEEWLLKFGFEKVVFDSEETGYGIEYHLKIKDGFLVYCDDFSIGIYGSESDYEGNSLAMIPPHENCNHVHQLQNLYFALTGEELTITEDGNNKRS
jgi:hypothetical protein